MGSLGRHANKGILYPLTGLISFGGEIVSLLMVTRLPEYLSKQGVKYD